MMEPNWEGRAMQFTDLPTGDLNMSRYAELMIHIGYPQRYCKTMGTKTAPLIVEAESAYRDLDATSANGIRYVKDNLVFPVAGGSFEDGMGSWWCLDVIATQDYEFIFFWFAICSINLSLENNNSAKLTKKTCQDKSSYGNFTKSWKDVMLLIIDCYNAIAFIIWVDK